MSQGKGRPLDLPQRGAPTRTERERRKAPSACRPDRNSRRQQVKEHAWSRFGLQVGKMARQAMVRRVQKGDVKYARKLTHTRTVVVLDHAGGEVTFLYSSATKEIVSFLPPEAAETAAWRRRDDGEHA
jgi:hypothetical protein